MFEYVQEAGDALVVGGVQTERPLVCREQGDDVLELGFERGGEVGTGLEEIFEIVKRLNAEQHVSLLLAEQNTNMALKYATYGYILESGRVVMDGEAQELRENEDVKEFYLGIGGGDRKSFRNVKSYKRRKRWLA